MCQKASIDNTFCVCYHDGGPGNHRARMQRPPQRVAHCGGLCLPEGWGSAPDWRARDAATRHLMADPAQRCSRITTRPTNTIQHCSTACGPRPVPGRPPHPSRGGLSPRRLGAPGPPAPRPPSSAARGAALGWPLRAIGSPAHHAGRCGPCSGGRGRLRSRPPFGRRYGPQAARGRA